MTGPSFTDPSSAGPSPAGADAAGITPGWVRTMTRYAAWQNGWMMDAVASLGDAEAARERGAFFGSILKTANHLLWAGEIWLGRVRGDDAIPALAEDHLTLAPDVAAWAARRRTADVAWADWAAELKAVEGTLTWRSGVVGGDVTLDLAVILTHVFNHQTHHRGQIHAMLTAAGVKTGTTDLVFMGMGV